MKDLLLLGVLCLFIFSPAATAQEKKTEDEFTSNQKANKIVAPKGKPILVDGKCQPDEWSKAAQVAVGGEYKLLVKKTPEYVFLCLKPPTAKTFNVDLYISPDDARLYTLHVSAKLGERILSGNQWKNWTTDWDWWSVEDWTANASRPVDFEKRTFLPREAIEFQIGRKRFGGNRWRVMIDFLDGSLKFPASADNLKRETWAEMIL